MKGKLKLMPLLAALFTSALFIQCAKDDAGLDDAKQFGPTLQSPYEYLEGTKKQKAIQALEKQFANAGRPAPQMRQVSPTDRSGDSWAVEFDEILLVTDSLGRKNFTYRVTHPRMSETVFYNLVHTEYKRGKYFYTTVKLVRYEMTDEFAGAYARGIKDMADFTGVIKFRPITDSREPILLDPPTEPEPEPEPEEPPLEPCIEDVVIVVPPPRPDNPNPRPVVIGGAQGNGGGSSGPGAEPDLSYYFGMADVHQAGTCWDWVKLPCSHGIHYGEDQSCVGGFKGATYLLNYCQGTVTSVYGRDSNPVLIGDPCLPVGYVGVLGPKRDRLNHEKNCAELKKLLETTDVKAAFTDLAGSKLHDSVEHGYSLRYYPDTEEHYPAALPPGTGGSNPSIPMPVGVNYFGGIHTHPSDPSYVPMFSGQDIVWFHDLIKSFDHATYGTTQQAILSKFMTSIVTVDGTYALKIDEVSFISKMNTIINDPLELARFTEQLDGLLGNEHLKINSPKNLPYVLLDFLCVNNLTEVSLYKRNTNSNNWDKIEIDHNSPGNTIIKNCN